LECLSWLDKKEGIGILGLQMGLGKTCIALGYIKLHPELKQVLIVCPAMLKINWKNEIGKWIGKGDEDWEVEILEGRTAVLKSFCKFTIVNYDILEGWFPALSVFPFDIIIGDEIQYISNSEAKRTQAFIDLARNIKKKVALSGTPIKQRPAEFFNILNIIDPEEFPSKYSFQHRYCDPKLESIYVRPKKGRPYEKQIWTFKGSTNWQELNAKVKKYMIRREKSEVLKDLPPKRKIIVPLPVENDILNSYLEADSAFREWIDREKEAKRNDKKSHIEHLKQMAYLVKQKSAIAWITDYLNTGEKLVVFALHTKVIEDLSAHFGKRAVVLDGSTRNKQEPVDRFQNDPSVQLFIGQLIAAGVGITLTVASAVAFLEWDWVPSNHSQAEDRIHRIGQVADSVTAYYLVADGTIDVHIAKMLIKKNQDVIQILDGKTADKFFGENEILDNLIENYLED
jgi:SWI/SNF-related matrix-associated actin-dependent regulator of chromatin subfamily A-like protein 1